MTTGLLEGSNRQEATSFSQTEEGEKIYFIDSGSPEFPRVWYGGTEASIFSLNEMIITFLWLWRMIYLVKNDFTRGL